MSDVSSTSRRAAADQPQAEALLARWDDRARAAQLPMTARWLLDLLVGTARDGGMEDLADRYAALRAAMPAE